MCSLLNILKGRYNPPDLLHPHIAEHSHLSLNNAPYMQPPHSKTFTLVPEQPSSKAFHKQYLPCATSRYLGKQAKYRFKKTVDYISLLT